MLRLHTYEKEKIRSRCQIANANRYENLSRLLLITHLLVSCFLLFLSHILIFRHCLLFLCPWSFLHYTNVCFCQKSTALRKWRIKLCALLGGRKYLRLDFVCFDFISVNRFGFVRVHVRIWLFTIVTICPKLHAMVSLFSILPFLYLFYAFDAVDYLNCQHLWHIHWSFYWFISLI